MKIVHQQVPAWARSGGTRGSALGEWVPMWATMWSGEKTGLAAGVLDMPIRISRIGLMG